MKRYRRKFKTRPTKIITKKARAFGLRRSLLIAQRAIGGALSTIDIPQPVERARKKKKPRGHRKWLNKLFQYAEHCWYCDCQLSLASATIDHIVPLSQGGTDAFENLRLACAPCNNARESRDPEEFRNSMRNDWSEATRLRKKIFLTSL